MTKISRIDGVSPPHQIAQRVELIRKQSRLLPKTRRIVRDFRLGLDCFHLIGYGGMAVISVAVVIMIYIVGKKKLLWGKTSNPTGQNPA